ncbi:MAG TPA: HlyD family efflux transporter periplasmic adaptor subunit [Anaerolineales bacterium]|nr:HlyD family efflux transporter periplasmic adaptor subunit [Anaerolineales bacterium]
MMKYRLLITIVSLSLLFTACSTSSQATSATPTAIPTVIADSTITAEGRVEPVRYAEIAFNASGVVSDVLVQEGETIKKGQPLIRLGDESDQTYAEAQFKLATAQKELNDLLNASGTDFAQAAIDLKDAKDDYDEAADYLHWVQTDKKINRTEARWYLDRTWRGYEYVYKTKSFRGPAPEDWITEAENDLALKKAKLDDAQRAYDRLKGGADTDQLAVLQARLDAAKADLAALAVLAPFDGIVADMKAKVGNSINAGEIAVTVADVSSWLVKTTDLTEIDVVKLKQDQPVTVTLDAIPDQALKGKILSIGQTYTENQGDIVYEVTVVLTDTHPAMRWGMTANVSFENEN